MNLRCAAVGVSLFACIGLVAAAPDRPEQDEKSVGALFAGLPKDLTSKVIQNPVRCDRVNDWLDEHVNGKGKTFEMRVILKEVLPYRSEDKTYVVNLFPDTSKAKILDADWRISLLEDVQVVRRKYFAFEAVPMADAERLAEAKQIVIKGTVKKVSLSRFHGTSADPDGPATISIALYDVEVDGKRWKQSVPKGFAGKGGGGPGGGDPFGGGFGGKGGPGGTKKKKGGGGSPPE
jgi:hypothetical protein